MSVPEIKKIVPDRTLIFGILLAALLTVVSCEKKEVQKELPSFTIESVNRTPDPLGVTLDIVRPREGEIVQGPDVEIYFASAGWETSEDGNHLRFILDNEIPVKHYDLTSSLTLPNVSPGAHALRMLAVRGNGESVKSENALVSVQFYVGEKIGDPPINMEKPILIYNSPTGNFTGSGADSILIDYWVRGGQIGIYDYKVAYTLDDVSGEFKVWKPAIIRNLSIGKHRLTLDLITPTGKPVLGNFNRTVHTITVEN